MEYLKFPANRKLQHLHMHLPYILEFPCLGVCPSD